MEVSCEFETNGLNINRKAVSKRIKKFQSKCELKISKIHDLVIIYQNFCSFPTLLDIAYLDELFEFLISHFLLNLHPF
jgi:hypothetical protein